MWKRLQVYVLVLGAWLFQFRLTVRRETTLTIHLSAPHERETIAGQVKISQIIRHQTRILLKLKYALWYASFLTNHSFKMIEPSIEKGGGFWCKSWHWQGRRLLTDQLDFWWFFSVLLFWEKFSKKGSEWWKSYQRVKKVAHFLFARDLYLVNNGKKSTAKICHHSHFQLMLHTRSNLWHAKQP